jgi:hypothetical protein
MRRRNLFTKWATELLCSEKEGGFSMAVKLITGLKETQDIQSEDDGARIYGTISSEDRVLDVGEKFAYQIITNNCVRIKSGEILMQGRHIRQTRGTYTDLVIDNGTQGQNRNDLIVMRYTKKSDTNIENAEFAVIKGVPAALAVDPGLTTGSIYEGCLIHEMALYRVSISGLSITSVTRLFKTLENLENRVTPIAKGGTGATTASGALTNLGITATELNYVDGVTSNIQTQLNEKANYETKSSTDFNSMTTPGLYTMRSSSTNAPTSGTYHSLIVNKSDNGNYVQQIAIKEGTTDMYLRELSDGAWSNWEKVGLVADYFVTISTNWTGSSAPYTQTITVTGLTNMDTPIVDVVLSSTTSMALSQLEAWNCVSKIETGADQITVTCLEDKPTVAILVQIKVVR